MTIDRIFVVHHSHTDVGYTDHQEVVLRLHADYIDQAVQHCLQRAGASPETRFRWTCETTGPLVYYLERRSGEAVDSLRRCIREGLIEVTAMAWNLTPLPSQEEVIRSLYTVRRLRETLGAPIQCAMQGDVNGLDWWLADLLPDIGVRYLLTAANATRGRAPLHAPLPFWWEGPSGRRLLVFNGWHYHYASLLLGLGRSIEAFEGRLGDYVEGRRKAGYPFDFLCFQYTNDQRCDNGGPSPQLCDFVQTWNEAKGRPVMEIATPLRVFRYLEERFGESLPVFRGDWTDWWADGVASSAAEVAVCRDGQDRVDTASRLWAMASAFDPRIPVPYSLLRESYGQLLLFGEHTWGAGNSVSDPYHPVVTGQWHWKAGSAYSGAALAAHAQSLAGDAVRRVVVASRPTDPNEIVVVNPCAFPIDAIVSTPARGEEHRLVDAYPIGGVVSTPANGVVDPRGRVVPSVRRGGSIDWLASNLPPLGWRLYRLTPGVGDAPDPVSDLSFLDVGYDTLSNRWFQLRMDARTGAIASLTHAQSEMDLVDRAVPEQLRGIGRYVYEQVAANDRSALWQAGEGRPDRREGFCLDPGFQRSGAGPFRLQVGRRDAFGASLIAEGQAPGCRRLRMEVELSAVHPWIDLTYTLEKEEVTDPEAVYIAFPFAVEDAEIRLAVPGTSVMPERDQLPGSCRDWYSVQDWVDISGPRWGVTLLPRDAPLIQVGGITTNRVADVLIPDRAGTVVSWALHNHWPTNFRAAQGGRVVLRYRIIPHLDPFDPVFCHEMAMRARRAPVVVRQTAYAEPLRQDDRDGSNGALVVEGSLLQLDSLTARVAAIKPAEDGQGLILRILELAGRETAFVLRTTEMTLREAWICSHLEENSQRQVVEDERCVRGCLGPHELRTLRLLLM